jgi:hypothetical protein
MEANMSNAYYEKIPENARGYGEYLYRVIGRSGYALHHTNDLKDAISYTEKMQDYYDKNPTHSST